MPPRPVDAVVWLGRWTASGRVCGRVERFQSIRRSRCVCRDSFVQPDSARIGAWRDESLRHRLVDDRQKSLEFHRVLPPVALAEHLASRVQGCEQRGCTVRVVIMRLLFWHARAQRQHGLAPVQRLNLRHLVHAQQHLPMQVQPHNVPHFLDKQRVFRELEGLAAVRQGYAQWRGSLTGSWGRHG